MKRNVIILIIVLAVIVSALGIVFLSALSEKNEIGTEKTITVTVDYGNGTSDEYTLKTEAKFLDDALKENKMIEGENGSYGMFITTVNGVKANPDQKQWWKVTKSGEQLLTGVSSIEISDSDKYELTLTTGYDTLIE